MIEFLVPAYLSGVVVGLLIASIIYVVGMFKNKEDITYFALHVMFISFTWPVIVIGTILVEVKLFNERRRNKMEVGS